MHARLVILFQSENQFKLFMFSPCAASSRRVGAGGGARGGASRRSRTPPIRSEGAQRRPEEAQGRKSAGGAQWRNDEEVQGVFGGSQGGRGADGAEVEEWEVRNETLNPKP